MSDIYCYPDTNVLRNKLGITERNELLEAEINYTSERLLELQMNPIQGRFDFKHLCDIHGYIFQDMFDWAGQPRTVDIGKGNLFCMSRFIPDYAKDVFNGFAQDCYSKRSDPETFIHTLAEHYGDMNALHPFREGNGRTQREFTRQLCERCGYLFDLSCTTHMEMLTASKRSFDMGDSSLLEKAFTKAISPLGEKTQPKEQILILSCDNIPETVYRNKQPDNHSSYEARMRQMDSELEMTLANIEETDIEYGT